MWITQPNIQQNLWFNPNLSNQVTFSPESNGALEIVKPPFGSWVRLNVVAIISPPAGFVTNGILSVILNGNLSKWYNNFNAKLSKLNCNGKLLKFYNFAYLFELELLQGGLKMFLQQH